MESERMRDALFASSRPANLRSSISSFSLSPCVRVAFTHSQSLTRAHPHSLSLSHTHTRSPVISFIRCLSDWLASFPPRRSVLLPLSRSLSPFFRKRESKKALHSHSSHHVIPNLNHRQERRTKEGGLTSW